MNGLGQVPNQLKRGPVLRRQRDAGLDPAHADLVAPITEELIDASFEQTTGTASRAGVPVPRIVGHQVEFDIQATLLLAQDPVGRIR
jgi:hypothetical protein